MAFRFERGTELAVVENLAVVDDPERTVFIAHRLMPTFGVDDGKPTVAEYGPRVDERPIAVRTAMCEGGAHCRHALPRIARQGASNGEYTADATHVDSTRVQS